MSFRFSWHNLPERLDELSKGVTLRTPLLNGRFPITDGQEHNIIIELVDTGESLRQRKVEIYATVDVVRDADVLRLLCADSLFIRREKQMYG